MCIWFVYVRLFILLIFICRLPLHPIGSITSCTILLHEHTRKFVSFGIFVLFHALFSVLFLCVKISRNGDRNRYREHVATMESRAENTVRYEKVFAKDFIAKNRNLNCLNQQNFVKNICNFFLLVSSLKFETIKPHQIFYIQNIETKNQLDWNAFHMRERNTITKQRFARKTKSVTSVTVVWILLQILQIKDEIKNSAKKYRITLISILFKFV